MRISESDLNQFWAEEAAHADPRTGAAARLLCLGLVNVELIPENFDQMVNNLALVAEQYQLQPDSMQSILGRHEPTLLQGDENSDL